MACAGRRDGGFPSIVPALINDHAFASADDRFHLGGRGMPTIASATEGSRRSDASPSRRTIAFDRATRWSLPGRRLLRHHSERLPGGFRDCSSSSRAVATPVGVGAMGSCYSPDRELPAAFQVNASLTHQGLSLTPVRLLSHRDSSRTLRALGIRSWLRPCFAAKSESAEERRSPCLGR